MIWLHFIWGMVGHYTEKETAIHSSVLAWRSPGTGEPGGLLSIGSHRVGHDWSDLAAEAARYKSRPIENAELQRWITSIQFSHSVISNSLWPHVLQHSRPPCPSPTPEAHSNSCPLSRWCHPQISSSVILLSSCPQSFPAWGSFQMSQFFASVDQSIGVSASTSDLPMDTQDWSPLGWTGWISLQTKGLSRVFSNTTVQKHQFFSAQLSL